MIKYIDDLKEITSLLACSYASNKNIMLYRNKTLLINPSAKTTLLAWKTNKYVRGFLYEICGEGDGCKTAIFILTSILNSLNKLPTPYKVKLGDIDVVGEKPNIEDLKKIAPELPDLLYEALLTNGTDLHISVEEGERVDIEILHSEGYVAKCPTPRWEKEISLKGPMVAMFNRQINKVEDVIPALENKIEGRPIVIVAPYFSKAVLDMITLNRNKGVIEAYAIETPKVNWAHEWIKDLESFVGGEVQTEFKKEFELQSYGSAYEIKIKLNEVIFEQYEDKVELTSKRIDHLNYQAQTLSSDLYFLRETLKQRVSALSGSLIRVKVGGVTEVEARNRRTNIEKQIQTLVSSIKGGIIREGLVLFLYNKSLSESDEIVAKGLEAPIKTIMTNYRVGSIKDLDLDKLRIPFPVVRLKELLSKIESIINVWSSIEIDISKTKV